MTVLVEAASSNMQRCVLIILLLAVSVSSQLNVQDRLRARQDRITIGTVQSLSGNGTDTSNLLAGYRLWVEETNAAGGIRVGNESKEIELKVLNSGGDRDREAVLYRKLVEVDRVDFLLGGAPSSTKAMRDAVGTERTLGISALTDGEWDSVASPHVFTVQPKSMVPPTVDFVAAARDTWGMRRVALIWYAGSERSTSQCNAVVQSMLAQMLDVDIVYRGAVEGELLQHYERVMKEVKAAEADFLVGCMDTTEQAQLTVQAATTAAMLKGWSQDAWFGTVSSTCAEQVTPAVVESTDVKLMYFTGGATSDAFYDDLSGWAQKILGPSIWHHDCDHDDAHFGSARALNALWEARKDLGDGTPMGEDTAAAVAAGVVLRTAIEAAASLESADVIDAMWMMDAETFFGRIQFDEDGSNAGITIPVVQWDCAELTHCEKRVRVPLPAADTATEAPVYLQPFYPACPANQIYDDQGQTLALQVYQPVDDAGGELTLPDHFLNPSCVPCMQGNMSKIKDLMGDRNSWDSFVNSCEEFRQAYRFGVTMMAGPGDEEPLLGIARGVQLVQQNFTGLSMMDLQVFEMDISYGSSAWGAVEQQEARDEVAAVVADVEAALPLGYFVWNEGLTAELGLEPLGDVCPGGGPQVTWAGRAICMYPAVRTQGRALAQLVEHFGWKRCHLVVSSGLEYAEMLESFTSMAVLRGFEVVSNTSVPGRGDEGREAAIEAVAGLDDCAASIVVLLTDRGAAEDVFSRVYGDDRAEWGGDKRFVAVGSEAASRAHNAPEGMLAVRTVGIAGSAPAEQVMAGSGRAWGTGVHEPGAAERRRSARRVASGQSAGRRRAEGEGEEEGSGEYSPWLDIAVEDRRLFNADAALVVAVATWKVLETAADVGKWRQVEAGVLGLNDVGLEGSTGLLTFQVAGANTSSSPRVLERTTGRLAFVNRRASGWVSLATLDLDGSASRPIVHTLNATLGQRAWEEEAVAWGLSAGRGARKPNDACACVIWRKIPPNPNMKDCEWAVEAVAVVAVGAAAVVAIAIGVWYSRRKRVDWAEQVVTKRMQELRVQLRMRKRDGFVLSTEARGLGLLGKEIRTVQRKQLEALARMTLLYDFEVRALDSLAWTMLSPSEHDTGAKQASLDGVGADRVTPKYETQYKELCNVLLETSRVLLDPSLDPNAVSETVGRVQGGSRARQYKWLQTPSSRNQQLRRGMSLKRELVGHVVFQAEHGVGTGPEMDDSSKKKWSASTDGSEGPMVRQHRRSTATEIVDEEAPETIEDRFNYFSKQVAQVQVWQDSHQALFKDLKENVVQNFMNLLHSACDELFQVMLKEDGGPALVSFHYPPHDHNLTPPGADAVGPNEDGKMTAWGAAKSEEALQLSAAPLLEGPESSGVKNPRRSLLTPPDAANEENPPLAAKGQQRLSIGAAAATTLPGCAQGQEELEEVLPATPASMSGISPVVQRSRSSHRGSCLDAHIVIRRQDHPRVRAIRLNEEDWREVDLERSSSYKFFFGEGLGAPGGGLGEVVRPVKDEEVYISQLYRRAVLLNDEFQVRVRKAVERRFGRRMQVHGAPVKTKMRMREKLLCYATERPEGADGSDEEPTEELPLAAYILDPIRSTVVCDGPSEMLEVARWLVNDGEQDGLPVVRVKNKFASRDASEYDGYRDLMVCVLYCGSHDLSIIGEIQIHDRRLHSLKLQMHKLYKVKRATKATMI